jgi:hypothetical protein
MDYLKEKQRSNERERERKIQAQIISRLMICHSVCFGMEPHLLMNIFFEVPSLITVAKVDEWHPVC